METLTLTELGRRLARRWRTFVLAGGIGLVVGLAVHLALPTRYEAVVVLRVDATDPSRVDMSAEEALARSRRVSAEALDAMGRTALSVDELERDATASTVKSSRVLHVAYVASSPGDAARGADALANAYLAVREVDGPQVTVRSASTAEVVDPARVPQSPVGPGRAAWAVGGVALSLLVAAPLAARPTRTREARAS